MQRDRIQNTLSITKKVLTNSFFQFILILFAAWVIFPVLWGISTSLKSLSAIYSDYSLIPKDPQWGNYIEAWKKGNFSQFFLNSIFYMLTVVFFMLLFSSLAAYAFARLRFPGKEFIFYLFLASLVMPLPTIFVTIYLLLQNFPIYLIFISTILFSLFVFSLGSFRKIVWLILGALVASGVVFAFAGDPKKVLLLLFTKMNLLNTRTGYILPQIAGGLPYSIFLMRSFFEVIPSDLEDAARIDGCSRLGIYTRIILPLSRPILAVTGIFGALSVWKEFLFAIVLFTDTSKLPIQAGLLAFQGTYKTQWNYLMAGVIITIVPVIIFYLILQRHIISGLTAGAVKG